MRACYAAGSRPIDVITGEAFVEHCLELVPTPTDPVWERGIADPASRWYREGEDYKSLFRFRQARQPAAAARQPAGAGREAPRR